MHRVPMMIGSNSWEGSLGRQIGGGFSPEFSAKLVSAEDKARLYPGLEGEALADEVFGDLIVHSGVRYVANQMIKYDRPVYSYYFSYVATERERNGQPGAAHTDDIAFVFQTLNAEQDLQDISFEDRKVSRLMNDYWVRFARRGDPNNYGLPEWPQYESANGAILEIGDEIEVREGLFAERMEYHIGRGRDLLQKAIEVPEQEVAEEPESIQLPKPAVTEATQKVANMEAEQVEAEPSADEAPAAP